MNKYSLTFFLCLLLAFQTYAQDQYELNSGWICQPIAKVKQPGEAISKPSYAVGRLAAGHCSRNGAYHFTKQ